jgi:hypothetical protein
MDICDPSPVECEDDPVGLVRYGMARLPADPAECATKDFDLLGDLYRGLSCCSYRARVRQLRLARDIDALPLIEAVVERNAVDAALAQADQATALLELYAIAAENACGDDFHEPLTPLGR